MPVPGHIIAAMSGAIDRHTNRANFFNVIETVEVSLADAQPIPHEPGTLETLSVGALRIFIVAMWIREDGDRPEDQFETEIWCKMADGTPVFMTPPIQFSFTRPCHRLVIQERELPGFPALGIYTIESRIRRAGEQESLKTMSCSFVVQERGSPPPEPPPAGMVET